jgi:hypothetical protein
MIFFGHFYPEFVYFPVSGVCFCWFYWRGMGFGMKFDGFGEKFSVGMWQFCKHE